MRAIIERRAKMVDIKLSQKGEVIVKIDGQTRLQVGNAKFVTFDDEALRLGKKIYNAGETAEDGNKDTNQRQ